jgi:hypothetical protein
LSGILGIPKGAEIAISDMLDDCAELKSGQEVVILAQMDGLYGGDNLVDQEAISWIQQAATHRGANVSVLWINEQTKAHAWRFPPVVKAGTGQENNLSAQFCGYCSATLHKLGPNSSRADN